MADQQPTSGPTLSIQKIYVKDLSLENPGAPQSFFVQQTPQVEVGLRTRGERIDADVYECVLTVTVTAKAADKTLFLIEASQAGVFEIRGIPGRYSADHGYPLPQCAVSLHSRNHCRRDDARRFRRCT